jgi:hypothetical protein
MIRFFLCVLSSIMICFSANAQTPDYFGNDPEWRCQDINYFIGDQCANVYNVVDYVVGDVTFDTITYKEIWRRGQYNEQWMALPMGGCNFESIYNVFQGYYRQEGSRIYKASSSGTSESLMIDYNVSIGDTIPGYIAYYRTVQRVDSILIGVDYHKILYADTNTNEVYIEGIANLANYGFGTHGEFFLGNGQILDGSQDFYCYAQNGVTLFESMPALCNFNVDIQDFRSQVEVRMTPNPAKEHIVISFDLPQTVSIQVVNIHGKIIRSTPDYNSNETLNVSGLNNGFYLVHIMDDNGLWLNTQKLIIQR